jgi:hypothetical protein
MTHSTRTLSSLDPEVATAIHMYANGFHDGVRGRKGITSGTVTELFLSSGVPLNSVMDVVMAASSVADQLHNRTANETATGNGRIPGPAGIVDASHD